jgi:hypothetical protein
VAELREHRVAEFSEHFSPSLAELFERRHPASKIPELVSDLLEELE